MNILEKIAVTKRQEVQARKEQTPSGVLEAKPFFMRDGKSLSAALEKSNSGLITEFKRKSPSRPDLNLEADVEAISSAYETAGAAGISVLTDETYFGGSDADLLMARQRVELPILRKDFIIDEYQVLEAKAIGADVILLIAALLTKKEIKRFSETARNLGLEILLEVHDEAELEASLVPEVQMVGVNNRNLKTFEVDINTSKRLSGKIPDSFVKVSESGISELSTVHELRQYGYQGFLMGENFMKTANPGLAASDFINSLCQ